jgi:hypothetical protein
MPTYPIQHLSFSSLKNYLSNQAGWYRSYVLNERTNELSPAALVGRTIHKYMELYYRRIPTQSIHEVVEAFFEEQAATVTDWGKTGSPEKAKMEAMAGIRDLLRAIGKGKLPGPRAKIVNIEEIMEEGVGYGVRIKAIPDLIVRKKDGLHIYDWKKVSAFNDKPTALYYMQALFNAYTAVAKYKEPIVDVTFVEVKPRKDEGKLKGSINLIKVNVDVESIEFRAVDRLIKCMLEDISGDKRHYLPNVTDMYAGEDEWVAWLKETNNQV